MGDYDDLLLNSPENAPLWTSRVAHNHTLLLSAHDDSSDLNVATLRDPLSIPFLLCNMGVMNRTSAMWRLLALFALLGMLIAPVSTIAAENAMALSKIAVMPGMQDDMPCCPDAKPVMPDCGKSCPLVIICTSSAVFALPRDDWSAARLSWTSHVYADMQFDRLSSVAAEPPARPPRS